MELKTIIEYSIVRVNKADFPDSKPYSKYTFYVNMNLKFCMYFKNKKKVIQQSNALVCTQLRYEVIHTQQEILYNSGTN